jgi:hypothetical protein
MKIALADLPSTLPALTALSASLAELVGPENVMVVPTDVSVLAEVERLRERVYEAWSEVGVLMNNAGIGGLDGVQGESRPEWFPFPSTFNGDRSKRVGLGAWCSLSPSRGVACRRGRGRVLPPCHLSILPPLPRPLLLSTSTLLRCASFSSPSSSHFSFPTLPILFIMIIYLLLPLIYESQR